MTGTQLLTRTPDGTDLTVQVTQAERIDRTPVLAKGDIPVHLIYQRVPREPDKRQAAVAHPQRAPRFPPLALGTASFLSATGQP